MSESSEKILLGVTGGIAAYKSPDLVRRLLESGREVRVVMTTGARAFVTPLTFQAVSGNPVHTELLDETAEAGMGHIELARWADRIVVAPATANFIACLAGGLAGDLLSTVCLATEAPIVIVPAMNRVMWGQAATRANCEVLEARGVHILGPGQGSQACGESGAGRMIEPAEIVTALNNGGLLRGVRVLLTAGPTHEPIDPVRYIGNRSSGKMGYAVAAAAAREGASVHMVSGPVQLPVPAGVKVSHVRSAAQMHEAVMAALPKADIFIGVAAVADYRPVSAAGKKIKKSANNMTIELEPTADILHAVARSENRPFTVGFAAETDDLETYARKKLQQKRLDMIAANLVAAGGTGFESDENELLVISAAGTERIKRAGKPAVARKLVQLIAEQYRVGNNESD